MTARMLDVLVNDQKVGRLHESDDLWAFDYEPAWADSPDGFDLSPALPRRVVEGPHAPAQSAHHRDGATQRPVQWYFDNLLPEEALRAIIATEANIPAEDAFGLLAHFGAESAGALVLCPPGQHIEPEQGLRPLTLAALSHRIDGLPQTSLSKDAPKRMSLAGAQHKMLLVLHKGALFEPLSGTPSTHILKPAHPSEHYPASVMNEYFTMRLAGAVGLVVPKVHRLYVPQPVYIVERFDRRIRANKAPSTSMADEVDRLHAIDTCQLLNKARSFKYTAARLDSLAQAVALCRTKAAARLQLFRWLVFNLLVGNGDNHLKNISFLVDASGIQVAPAYDLLSTAAYDTRAMADEAGRWPDSQLALSIGDATRFSAVTRPHVLQAGRALGLNEASATRELDRLIKAVPDKTASLTAEIESTIEQDLAASPQADASRRHIAGERHVLRVIQHLIVPEMVKRLS